MLNYNVLLIPKLLRESVVSVKKLILDEKFNISSQKFN